MKSPIIYFIILVLICGLALTGCYHSTPPDIEIVQDMFDKNSGDIQTVVDFLKDLEYKNVYITQSNGVMNADLNAENISDPNVILAVNRLLESGNYYHIFKVDNTIHLLQWKGLHDVGCGIAYVIDETTFPEIEYATEILPLSSDGWFYYVSNYELWKQRQPKS